MRRFIKHQMSVFLFGLVFWLPISVVVFIFVFIFDNLEKLGREALFLFIPAESVYPGLGIAFGILVIYISGVLLHAKKIRGLLSKIPLLGLLFGAGEVITIDRLLHLTPCLFLMSPSCISYGWIFSEEKVKIGNYPSVPTLVNVYYPNVPSIVTGQVFPVRKSTVIKLGNPSKEIIDLLLYSFRSPKELRYLPWEDETPEQFVRRAQAFGIYTCREEPQFDSSKIINP